MKGMKHLRNKEYIDLLVEIDGLKEVGSIGKLNSRCSGDQLRDFLSLFALQGSQVGKI